MGWLVFGLVLFSGCGGDSVEDSDMGPAADLGRSDFKMNHDLRSVDLRPGSDLSEPVAVADMTTPVDLSHPPDLVPPPPPPDMTSPPDMTPPCGGLNQGCCAGDTCSAGTCMRLTSTGAHVCIEGGGCGGYLNPCCTTAAGTFTYSGAGYCRSDPNAAHDGNTLGWYRCFSNGCRP